MRLFRSIDLHLSKSPSVTLLDTGDQKSRSKIIHSSLLFFVLRNCSFVFFNPPIGIRINRAFLQLILLFFNRIIGLYTTFVIVVARLLRTVLQISQTIMFNELPNVDRIWHLLKDIYLVRECSYLRIEEDLFAKLLFLYRSPETLVRFTKSKRH